MFPAYTKILRPANRVFETSIVQPTDGAGLSQFCSTSSERPAFTAHFDMYGRFASVCTPMVSATAYCPRSMNLKNQYAGPRRIRPTSTAHSGKMSRRIR